MSEGTQPADEKAAPRRSRKRLLVIGGAALLLAGLGGGGAAWWFLGGAAESAHEEHGEAAVPATLMLPPVTATYFTVPEVMGVLADPPRVGRLGVVLEASPPEGRTLSEPELQRLAEELRRWLATQPSSALFGASATWTARASALALARSLYPDVKVQDVLVKSILLQ